LKYFPASGDAKGVNARGDTTGTQTFLFTDLEGSTRTWEREPEAMHQWLARHDRIVADAITAHGGQVFKHTGDGLCAVFGSAADAARAALDAQIGLAAAGPSSIGPLRARVALHTGDARERAGDFYGPTLNRCARLLAVGHGGQVLLSASAAALLHRGASVGEAVTLADLGKHRLRDLQEREHIWQLAAPGLDCEFPPLRSLDAFVHNLPVQRSSFIGREAEAQAVRDLVRRHRLVTVTGIGGCGKTRLALEVAAGEVDRFTDGVFFVDLSTVAEPTLVSSTIAATLRVPATGGTSDERLSAFLSDRYVLILLDNCEHLLDACATEADRLLTSCPHVSMLATSRESLALEGEHVWRVPSLRLPAGYSAEEIGQSEAVRLFLDRAAAVRPSFALTADNAAAVVDICRRLDGIPLALELAAARIAHLAPREIAGRLSDRFHLLTGGRRGIQRQQTLQAVLDWSHELLGEPERILLRRLAVFAGGCTLDAVQGVCGGDGLEPESIIDVLGSLVARSLVEAEDQGDHTRYRLLETMRLYAQDRLVAAAEAERVRNTHAEWYLHRAETPEGPGVQVLLWFPQGDVQTARADLDNMRQATDWWLTQGRYDLVVRMAASTISAFHNHGRFDEPAEWLERALAREAELPRALRVRCYTALAAAAEIRGEFFVANERARAAVALAEDPVEVGGAYSFLVGNLTWITPDEAERLLETAPVWTKPLGPRAEDYIWVMRGWLATARHDYDQAIACLSRANVSTRLGSALFVVRLVRGDIAEAAALLESPAMQGIVSEFFEYYQPFLRALITAVGGDRATARAHLVEAVALVRRGKIPLGLADCVIGCAVAACHAGDPERASELLAAVQAATGGGLRTPMSMCLYRHYVRTVRTALDRAVVARARAVGATLTLDAALARELSV
jgi:predicted ATPase/class 3 adenylate cyclase